MSKNSFITRILLLITSLLSLSRSRLNINYKRISFIILIVLEILIISILLFQIIYRNTKNEVTSISPLQSSSYDFSQRGNLKYFYEPKPNITRTDTADWLPNKIAYPLNNEGSNNLTDLEIEKPADTYRIVVLGDSYTFGIYVDQSKNYPAQLESNLNSQSCGNIKNFEVINLGVPGYDLEYSLERFKSKGLKYSPDLVIWFIKDDDITQINELIKIRAEQIRKEFEKNGEIKNYEKNQTFYPYMMIVEEQLKEELGIENLIMQGRSKIDQLRSLYGGKLVLLSFANKLLMEHDFFAPYQQQGSTYFFEDFTQLRKTYYNFPDRHPNEIGYKYIADQVFAFIKSNDIIHCNIE